MRNNTVQRRTSAPSESSAGSGKTGIKGLQSGDFFTGVVKIMRKAKPGPVVMDVSDGLATIDAVIANTDYETGDVVYMEGGVSERQGRLQIEVFKMQKSDKSFDDIVEALSEPKRRELSIQSEKYEKLKPYFLRIAKKIRRAILNHQPIMIRHHADADGITSGIAMEKACAMLMEEVGIEPEYNLYRSPSRAPFYEFADLLKDISFSEKILAGHGQQKPLILVQDNGSTPEDEFAMKTAKITGYDVIVIDHHNPVVLNGKKTAVCQYLLDHVNPYMEGLDSSIPAGVECYEIARFIHEGFEDNLLPAVSVTGDRVNTPESEEYIRRSGMTREELTKMVIAIDFLAYNLKFDSGRHIYDKVFNNKTFVASINEEVEKGVETQLQSTLPYLRTMQIGRVTLSYIDLEKYTLRFKFPTPGKLLGYIHDSIKEGREEQPIITLGLLSDMIIVRATKPVLPVQQIMKTLQEQIPEANVDGGGHECAGSLRFVGAHADAVLENIKVQLRSIAKEQEQMSQ